MDIKPHESADNSDVEQRDEATAIRELKGEELVFVAGAIRSFGLVNVDK